MQASLTKLGHLDLSLDRDEGVCQPRHSDRRQLRARCPSPENHAVPDDLGCVDPVHRVCMVVPLFHNPCHDDYRESLQDLGLVGNRFVGIATDLDGVYGGRRHRQGVGGSSA